MSYIKAIRRDKMRASRKYRVARSFEDGDDFMTPLEKAQFNQFRKDLRQESRLVQQERWDELV